MTAKPDRPVDPGALENRKRRPRARRKPKAKAKQPPPLDPPACESAAQTPEVGTLRPSPRGGLIRYGNPGNRGGGRPPDAFKSLLRDALAQHEAEEMIAKILRGESFIHKGELVLVDAELFLKAYAWAADRAYGKAAPEAPATAGGKQLVFRLVVMERTA